MKNETTLISDSLWTLTVLGGLHQDGQCRVRQGTSVLGSAPQCDIVLSDTGIRSEHLLIVRNDEVLTIYGLCGGVCVDGKELALGEPAVIEQATLISVGLVTMGIGPHETDWKEISGQIPGQPDGSTTVDDSNSLNKTAVPPDRSRPFAPLILAGITGLAVFAMMFWWVDPFRGSDGNTPAQGASVSFAALAERIQPLSLDEVTLENSTSGPTVGGYVENPLELQRLTAAVADLRPVMSVFVASEMERFVADRIRGVGTGTTVRYSGNGVIAVSGVDSKTGSLVSLLQEIESELPGLRRIDASIARSPNQPIARSMDTPDEPLVISGVNGVNTGHRTPHLSSGKNYIFPGGVLKNGMSVVAIENSRVLVDDRGSRKSSTINAR